MLKSIPSCRIKPDLRPPSSFRMPPLLLLLLVRHDALPPVPAPIAALLSTRQDFSRIGPQVRHVHQPARLVCGAFVRKEVVFDVASHSSHVGAKAKRLDKTAIFIFDVDSEPVEVSRALESGLRGEAGNEKVAAW